MLFPKLVSLDQKIIFLYVVQAHLDHHAVAVVDSDKVQGVLHFYQINGPTSPVLITGLYYLLDKGTESLSQSQIF